MILSANKFKRKIEDVHLIAVTKTHPSQSIISAYRNNIFIIGENKVQEAIHKLSNDAIPKNMEIHLIGHLQSNKINKAISIFDVIQTVDSLSLAHKLNAACKTINKLQRIYIQINVGEDPSKHGFHINQALDVAKEIDQLSFLKLEGVMMIPPFIDMNEHYRSIFKKTKKIQLDIFNSGIKNCINVSMGMSRDYQLAIEEGATHIRIGTALFGNRN